MITFDATQLWVMFSHWLWLNFIFLGSGVMSVALMKRAGLYPDSSYHPLGRTNVTVSGYWCLGLVLLANGF